MGKYIVKTDRLSQRVFVLVIGLFIMGLGVALSVRSMLGTTPISSIPTVVNSLIPVISIGTYTAFLNILMVGLQYLILRGRFGWYQLMQIPLVLIFGVFIDFHLSYTEFLITDNYLGQMGLTLLSCLTLGTGVFLQVRSGISYLPVEGLVVAIKKVYGGHFSSLKVAVDGSIALIAIIIGVLGHGKVVAVREGTLLSVFLVGSIVGAINHLFPEPQLKQAS